MSRHDTAENVARLHAARLRGPDGAPAMTEGFLTYLDRQPDGNGGVTTAAPLTLDEACTRLQAEHPVWWECVTLCCRQGLTEREASAQLGVSPALAHRRKTKGLEQLALWCGVGDAGDVALLLRHRRRAWAS